MAGSEDSGSEYGICDEYIDPWCDPCENAGKYARAFSYCSVCVEFFCKQCNQSHSNFQITKSHKVKHGTNMPSCQDDKPPRYEHCGKHSGALKEYFCTDHRTMICWECQNDHTRCFVKHANVLSKTLNNNDINSLAKEVTDAKKEASNVKYALECNIKSIEVKRNSMLKTAEKEYDEMKTNIAARFKNVTKVINDKCDEEVSLLTTLIKEFSNGITEYDSALNIIHKEATSKLDIKSFIKLQSLVDIIRHNNTRLYETTETMKAGDLEFDVDIRWTSLSSSCPEIGKVQRTVSPCSTTIGLREIQFPPVTAEPFREITISADSLERHILIESFGIGRKFAVPCFGFLHALYDDHMQQYSNDKIPMNALIAPDKETLVAFGYEAENKYGDLITKDETTNYYYFSHFGMNLRNGFKKENLENLTIKDSSEKALPAMTLLTLAVKFFYEDRLDTLHKRQSEIYGKDILWTIIVPSFWTEADKTFTKDAAKKAGILATDVCIVTEAQAAATFCRSMLKAGGKDVNDVKVTAGQKYLILDVGEQDSQIVVDTFTPNTVPELLHIASLGGVFVSLTDEDLNNVFAEIVGDDVLQRFIEEEPDDWLATKTSCKEMLTDLVDSGSTKGTLHIPEELLHLYKELKGKTLSKAIAANFELAANVRIIGNKMRISSHFLRIFFDVPATKIILILKYVLQNILDEQINTIFMIGEIANVRVLQNIVRSSFANINFVFPTEPFWQAIPQGAVIHGFLSSHKKLTRYSRRFPYRAYRMQSSDKLCDKSSY